MRVSLNSIKQYTSVDLTVIELVAKINSQLGGVEEVIDLAEQYKDVVIAKIISCSKHPNGDRLTVCLIDDGRVVKSVPRNDKGFVQVVCGAPNVREGLFVAWLPPASVVPSTAFDAEPFVLSARDLRGITSQGMLASPKELALGDAHQGILEIDPDEWKPSNYVIAPGASFSQTYGLDDTIIDIENKMFTHRPDLFGQIGIAREVAGIQNIKFLSPEWYTGLFKGDTSKEIALTVTNETPEKAPRFMAVAIKNVSVRPSPIWLQAELVRLGGKPINNIVDVTNYIMLLTAQPTHAYDYDKLRGQAIGVRMAHAGETIALLNNKTYTLTEKDIVIVDGASPIGLAGIMGGNNSEVSSSTINIVLEVANFDMYTLRRSSMNHGLFTDALTRFNKGQSPYQNDYVLNLLIDLIKDVTGGVVGSDIFNEGADLPKPAEIAIDVGFVNARLGLNLTQDEIKTLLENVEFIVTNDFKIILPFWRTDIEIPEDIVEEVGRLYGFDKLPLELPSRSIAAPKNNPTIVAKAFVRQTLSKAGANEVLTYSFVHENILQKAGQDANQAYRLSNALSPDLQYYRLSLTPSLLDKVHMNSRAGYDCFALFEINKVHYKNQMDPNEPSVPNEDTHVAFAISYSEKSRPEGAAYFHAKRYLELLVDVSAYSLIALDAFDVHADEWGRQLCAPYEPERSVVIVKDNQIWGVAGEYTQSAIRSFKLPAFTAGFEVHSDVISTAPAGYRPLSKYPSITQDISIKVAQSVTYESIVQLLQEQIEQCDDSLRLVFEPVGAYQAAGTSEVTTTFRLQFTSSERTLRDSDVKPIVDTIGRSIHERLNGVIV